jgi:glycosyltransferase involved in cell wall biosynthesis
MTRVASTRVSPEPQPPTEVGTTLLASIVITTFRRKAMLAQLLDALCPQVAGHPVEIIVVDNCPAASARPIVEARRADYLHYRHEARSGVVHARNCGVSEASGTYVIFLDDDELPCDGWLEAWLRQAEADVDASFGRITPTLLAPCPEGLIRPVQRNFRRDMHRPNNADISRMWAYLGTGNTMFHKDRCLAEDEPFHARFNARGGEDVWLIRDLVMRGHRLVWNHDALVEELVPADRMTLSFLELRRFNQGQLRGILAFGEGDAAGYLRAAAWMAAGAVQLIACRFAAAVASIFAREHADRFRCDASGGLGKLLWWHKPRVEGYGSN